MKELIAILLVFGVPVAFTRMLPQFSVLQKMYLGNIDYGGVYSDLDVKQYLFKEPYKRNLPDNATCMLRMSALLNVTTKQPGSEQGLKNYYYFYDRDELLYYLKDMYGSPLKSNKTEVFRGQVGIMFIDTGSETNDDCSVLLWNGNGFHQGKGLIRHKNFQSAQLWAAPTAGCSIDVNVKQSGGTTCFPSKSQVELRSGKKIPISDLAIGDTVKTFSKTGQVLFSPVVTFLDQTPDYKGLYYTITAEGNTQLTLSEAHLIFQIRLLRGPFGEHTSRSVHASQIKPGDRIVIQDPTCKWATMKMVTSVSVAERVGAFAPVTQEGTMIVDGVWVSCYADIVDHDLADSLMAPLKSFYGWAPRMLGARGKYAHGYLKQVLRPIGLRVFGKDRFYQGPDSEVMGGKETITSVFDRDYDDDEKEEEEEE